MSKMTKPIVNVKLPWWPSCLDHGVLINVEAPGCGTSRKVFILGYSCTPRFSKVPASRHVHNSLNRVLIKEAILV